jgi:hypothetical protein
MIQILDSLAVQVPDFVMLQHVTLLAQGDSQLPLARVMPHAAGEESPYSLNSVFQYHTDTPEENDNERGSRRVLLTTVTLLQQSGSASTSMQVSTRQAAVHVQRATSMQVLGKDAFTYNKPGASKPTTVGLRG